MPKFNWPIIGHQKIIQYLQNIIENNALNHAYLFYGPDNLGKSLIVDYFIKSIYCASQTSIPCNACLNCRQIQKQIHPDIIYLNKQEDKKNISVEQVRQTRSKAQLSTFLNSHKVILIPQADQLSLAASNALLKVLEEPTKRTIFVFISAGLKNIPATILSRLQLIKFMPVAASQIEKYLLNKNIDKQTAYELSHLAIGHPGRVLPLIEHPRLLNDYKNNLSQLLNVMDANLNQRFELVEKLAAQDRSIQARQNSINFLQNLSSCLRDILLIKNMCFDKITHIAFKQQLSQLALKYSPLELVNLLKKIKHTQKYIEQNVNSRLALENLVLEF